MDRRDDYGQLLARGDVIHRREDVEDVDAWRSEIKRQARADKIKVRTGVNENIVWAVRLRPEQQGWQDEVRRYTKLLSRAVPLAVELRHEPAVALRDGDEVICACERCDALGYGSDAEDLIGGSLFEDECPHEDPPKLTGLAMMFVSRSRWP